MKIVSIAAASTFALLCGGAFSAELGYLDPEPILSEAEAAIGARKIQCVVLEGVAYTAAVGQARLNGYDVDWPRGENLENYQRTMDWSRRAMLESFDREPGHNPAAWKYGSGWRSGTARQQNQTQTFGVVGDIGWSQDGEQTPQRARATDAEVWQLDLWMNPHGFLKAARLPGADPVATWRWELGEMGRDGPTRKPEKVWIVTINVLGKYRVDATINQNYLLQRIHTRIGDPVLGDFNYEHEFADDTYIDIGAGVRFPTIWHHHQGWDDNYQAQSINAGHNAFGGRLDRISTGDCEKVTAPKSLLDPISDDLVEVAKLDEGIWLAGGTSHNSVIIELDEYIVVVEAPLNETRSLAVIEAAVRLVPDKPIRYLINTHQHHDHIGGLRTYMHIGATIVTHWKNYDFYTRDVLNYAPRSMDPDMLSLWPPTELAEGYQYETVRENFYLSDGARTVHASYVHPLNHVEGMLVVHLPREKILIQSDMFESLDLEPDDAAQQLLRHIVRLDLDVDTIVPIHGQPAAWASVRERLAR